MKTQFSFGKNGIEVSVPERFECQVLRSRSAAPLPDPATAIAAALDSPIGCEPLAVLAAGKDPPPSRSATSPARRRTV